MSIHIIVLIIIFVLVYIGCEKYSHSLNRTNHIIDTSNFIYRKKEDDTMEIVSYIYHGENFIAIPDEICGCPVTSIAPLAFLNCQDLKDIDLPTHIEEIGCNAFKGCKKLKYMTYPDKLTDKINDEDYCRYIGLETFYRN
ncbi:MAG: leucine-rich repeat domain-containing protein [Erysipelotrichaceae bacterium]|nr:leucine-rich repeat domain-containing protein [Erysipelotrichaceae bacterium]